MRQGFRVYDADTHVNPCAEVLDRYVDPDFRPRSIPPTRCVSCHAGLACPPLPRPLSSGRPNGWR